MIETQIGQEFNLNCKIRIGKDEHYNESKKSSKGKQHFKLVQIKKKIPTKLYILKL